MNADPRLDDDRREAIIASADTVGGIRAAIASRVPTRSLRVSQAIGIAALRGLGFVTLLLPGKQARTALGRTALRRGMSREKSRSQALAEVDQALVIRLHSTHVAARSADHPSLRGPCVSVLRICVLCSLCARGLIDPRAPARDPPSSAALVVDAADAVAPLPRRLRAHCMHRLDKGIRPASPRSAALPRVRSPPRVDARRVAGRARGRDATARSVARGPRRPGTR